MGGYPAPGAVGTPNIPAAVEGAHGAMRVHPRPLEFVNAGNLLGHYAIAAKTGVGNASLTGGSAIFSARWATTNVYAVIKRVSVGIIDTVAAFAAQAVDVDVVVSRAWTASDTGGTALVITNNAQKLNTRMGASLITDMRVLGATNIAAGTRTQDAQAFGAASLPCNVSGGNISLGGGCPLTDLYVMGAFGQHPVICGLNEGINVRVITTDASQDNAYYVRMDWAEIESY